jgi:hypothetical protein
MALQNSLHLKVTSVQMMEEMVILESFFYLHVDCVACVTYNLKESQLLCL